MRVIPIPTLQDNYSYLILPPEQNIAAVVDCVEVEPVLTAAQDLGVQITAVLSTHHHWDHVGGNEALAQRLPVEIYGYAGDAERIPGITRPVEGGQQLSLGSLVAEVMVIPAHTSGHIAYHFAEQRTVFTGDTLFAGGCGRLFEGDAAEMMSSLGLLNQLSADTKVYCGHEYTIRNLEFAQTLEPQSKAIQDKLAWSHARRRDGQPTVPTTLASERETNPFLRISSPELQETLARRFPDGGTSDADRFAQLRGLKDEF